MLAYYNENDAEKAACLRQFISDGLIAKGEVDERSIKEIQSSDLQGFAQCHFFAGFGVWSYALRLAGWPDDRPVWTGSCPCPSFSAAGKGGGFNDPRHLWPDWSRLVCECRPPTIFGEQADDAIGYGWLDLVQTDLERQAYAVGKAVLGACSVGAPHIRQRLYFVAYAEAAEILARSGQVQAGTGQDDTNGFGNGCLDVELANANSERCGETRVCPGEPRPGGNGVYGWLANAHRGRQSMRGKSQAQHEGRGGTWFENGNRGDGYSGPGFVNGFWRTADWVLRKRWNRDDYEWCPTEPGTFPLAHGTSNRVLKIRGYGDAIIPQVAAAFIESAS